MIVARGEPLDFFGTRHADGRDVLLVLEAVATSLPRDLDVRLRCYAQTLSLAIYIVADIQHRQILLHSGPGEAEITASESPSDPARSSTCDQGTSTSSRSHTKK